MGARHLGGISAVARGGTSCVGGTPCVVARRGPCLTTVSLWVPEFPGFVADHCDLCVCAVPRGSCPWPREVRSRGSAVAVRWRWGLQSRPVRSATASGTGAPPAPRGRGRGGAFGLVACWRPGAGPAPSRSRRSRTVARSVRSRVRLSRHRTASRGRVKIRCARAAYTLAGYGRESGCDVDVLHVGVKRDPTNFSTLAMRVTL